MHQTTQVKPHGKIRKSIPFDPRVDRGADGANEQLEAPASKVRAVI